MRWRKLARHSELAEDQAEGCGHRGEGSEDDCCSSAAVLTAPPLPLSGPLTIPTELLLLLATLLAAPVAQLLPQSRPSVVLWLCPCWYPNTLLSGLCFCSASAASGLLLLLTPFYLPITASDSSSKNRQEKKKTRVK